jgi:2-polyprenyl-6-methoxyphenol hydroxylase-like FAD-dependent oxidoreductase
MADAIVIGGGPTGLTTAMLLANRGFEVVVLDRDGPPPDDPEEAWATWERRSVSQFRQVHLLQAGGTARLREHLPEVVSELEAVGAVRFNMIECMARVLPGGPGDVDYGRFETYTTCRRPVLELGFVKAARAQAGIDIRNGVVVTGLVCGTSALPEVPHVVGVETSTGETLRADLVVDASGRRSPVGAMLERLGGRPVAEQAEEVGFVYDTIFYRGDHLPEARGDFLSPIGSISLLTIPGDRGHWAVTVYHSPRDKPMRRLRDPAVFERVIRALPLHAHWVDGTRLGDVATMTSTTNARRSFVVDGTPVATGLVPVGDAWGFTNPSLGRGITLGIMHAVDVVDAVVRNLDDPVALAAAWARATESNAEPWHEATVGYDRIRGPEVEAYRQGLPDPHDPNDPAVAGFRAFNTARHHDPLVLSWFGEQMSCFTLTSELIAREGVFERVLEVALAHEPYHVPGPDRRQLESLLA